MHEFWSAYCSLVPEENEKQEFIPFSQEEEEILKTIQLENPDGI